MPVPEASHSVQETDHSEAGLSRAGENGSNGRGNGPKDSRGDDSWLVIPPALCTGVPRSKETTPP